SRYFEPIVSFPFVPGHEVVGELDDGSRVVLEPVLGCAARGIDPMCPACANTDVGRCTNIAFGHLEPGLQTGYCCDTGGGWSTALAAHATHPLRAPDDCTDEAAVRVEPAACGLRGALKARRDNTPVGLVAVVGAGTLGLCAIAGLRRYVDPERIVAVAKHPEQRRLASDLGADVVIEPGELKRAVRRITGSMAIGDGDIVRLAGGADVVIDCVGKSDSIQEALGVVRPG